MRKSKIKSSPHLGSGINFIVDFTTNTIHTVLLLGCKSLFIKPVTPVTKAIYYTFLSLPARLLLMLILQWNSVSRITFGHKIVVVFKGFSK